MQNGPAGVGTGVDARDHERRWDAEAPLARRQHGLGTVFDMDQIQPLLRIAEDGLPFLHGALTQQTTRTVDTGEAQDDGVGPAQPEPRRYMLAGNFEPEAFSLDGRALFVIEFSPPLAPYRYRVRSLDLGKTWADIDDATYRATAVFPTWLAIGSKGELYVSTRGDGVVVGTPVS